LRREEVAVLAGVSADYYTRLEQGRELSPSAQVIDALCTALRLSHDGREYAYRLAGLAPGKPTVSEEVTSELRQLMESIPNSAAYVVNPALRVIATNATAAALLGPAQLEVAALHFLFLDPAARDYFSNWDEVARASVSALRYAHGHPAPHPEVAATVQRLLYSNTEFPTMWEDHAVAGLSLVNKSINHPDVGRLELTYQTLDVRDSPGHQLIIATAPVGSPSADGLALLGTLHATPRRSSAV
jgi:transcriptional regulator with XRE-family HTH domain